MLDKQAVIPDILRQHVEGTSFFWMQRGRLFHDPEMGTAQLGRNDLRLSAHLAAAMASGPDTLAEAERRFDDFPEDGEIFAWLAPALLAEDPSIPHILERVAVADPKTWRGASGAVAWVGIDALKPFVSAWSKSHKPLQRYLALSAFTHYRVDPGDELTRYLRDTDHHVRARALRLAGELGNLDRLPKILAAMTTANDPTEQFWAARSAMLLGDRSASSRSMRKIAEGNTLHADAALELVVLSETGDELRRWLGTLIQTPDRRAAAIEISGLVDDPAVIHWLLSKCTDPSDATAVTRALRIALPFDLEDANVLVSDPDLLPSSFAGLDGGPWAVADRVRTVLDAEKQPEPFTNLPSLRQKALAAALNTPGHILSEWRAFAPYPAWS